ncbi:MAG: hypothetical protein HFI05_04515 [Lachnospiraceae bacterium]|jgi:hypothetical protein|nr:hypothetical protein [Lachnospiraceae bacterium]
MDFYKFVYIYRSGLTTILVESGYGLERLEYEVFPDFVCKDLEEAVLKIKRTT